MKKVKQIERILNKNLYMTLASVDKNSQPWSTPVFYATDDNFNFYWYSQKDTRHSLNIKGNNKIAISIFSTSGEDALVGVYAEGRSEEIDDTDIDWALKTYSKKAASNIEDEKNLTKKEDFLNESPLRMYKFIPEKIYISNDAKKFNGKWLDSKSEVNLIS